MKFRHKMYLLILPDAIEEKEKTMAYRSDKMKLINNYLKQKISFEDAFYDAYDIVMWVDWREEDDAIIRYCEDIILAKNIRKSNIISCFCR